MKLRNLFMFLFISLLVLGLVGCKTDNKEDDKPSDTPSETPDDNKNDTPSDEPSDTPSDTPSEEPSDEPSEEVSFTITSDVENGYTYDDTSSTYVISVSGTYTVSGTLNGSIAFSDTLDSKCTLVLNNVSITSTKEAINWQSESSKVVIYANEATTNTIKTTGSEHNAIASSNNIDFDGDGVVTIESANKHAVSASNIEVKGNVTLNLSAKKDGLHGKSITITSGTLNISNCGSDAIEAELNSSGKKGTITVNGGTITITSCAKSLTAEATDGVTVSETATVTVDGNPLA